MSRCFPFPPHGYEPKASTGIIDLLIKEKCTEKKHKKEKRDKEKREHKEKRDRDRSKDKHKEKKDEKKHKDRKKEKDGDRGGTLKCIKAEGGAQGHNNLHVKESWQKTDEGKDSKIEEELGRRTRDDGAENPMVGSFTDFIQRKFEGVGAASVSPEKERAAASRVFSVQVASVQRRNEVGSFTDFIQRKFEGVGAASASPEKERAAASRVFSVQVASVQRRNDSCGLSFENGAISPQRRAEFISSTTALEKERSIIMQEKVAFGRGVEESRNHGISRSMESVSGLAIRTTEGFAAGMEKEKGGERSLVSNPVIIPGLERGKLGTKILASSSLAAPPRRKDVLCMPAENLSSIHDETEALGIPPLYSRIKGMDSVLTIENGGANGGEMFKVGRAVEKDIHKKVEGENKTQGKQAEDMKGHKDSGHRLTKEKKREENIAEKADVIEHNKLRNLRKKDQVDALNSKSSAPHKDNAIEIVCAEGTMNKRKYLNSNGYQQENDQRPDKTPRMASSSPSLLNGRSLELPLSSPSSIPLQSGAINNSRQGRSLENKRRKINGNAISPGSGGLSLVLLPHPDSKYLSQIYSVPKMAELPEIEDQEWLSHCYVSLQKSKIELLAEKIPLVFAEAMRIDSADILALPYVVPF